MCALPTQPASTTRSRARRASAGARVALALLAVPSSVHAFELKPPIALREAAWPTFVSKVNRVVLNHPVVTSNAYTKWFARGVATDAEARDLTIQFSVFSNLFLEAQLAKIINAGSLEEMREVRAAPRSRAWRGAHAGRDPLGAHVVRPSRPFAPARRAKRSSPTNSASSSTTSTTALRARASRARSPMASTTSSSRRRARLRAACSTSRRGTTSGSLTSVRA